MNTRRDTAKQGRPPAALLLLAVSAVTCSRLTFLLIADPEGPNLVVVLGLGALLFVLALAAYVSPALPTVTGWKRAVGIIPIQILAAVALALASR